MPHQPARKWILVFMWAMLVMNGMACSRGNSGKSLEHFRKGKLAYSQRRLPLAVEEFTKAAAGNADFPAARLMKGKAQFYQGKFKESERTFRAIHDACPGNAAAHYWLGRAFLQMKGKHEDARRHLLKAVSLHDGYFNAHFYLGVIYEREGKIKKALIEYRRATLIKKDFDRIHRRLADLYKRAGFPGRAAGELSGVK